MQLQQSNQELESHKSKRLTARNEIIGLAQVLSKMLDFIAHHRFMN